MSSLAEKFLTSVFTGWNLQSFLVYLGCVVMTQVMGANWYGPRFFSKTWTSIAFPHAKTPEELKRITQDTHMGMAYATAMVGSATALFVLRGALFMLEANGSAIDGAFVGFLLWFVDSVFGIMHPFFEDKPFVFYSINQGYHMVCLIASSTILGAFS